MNTPGIPSVIRKRAKTPPHLRKPTMEPSKPAAVGTSKQEAADMQQKERNLETILHAGDILEAAKVLELNLLKDTAMLWIAEEFWLSPLPDNWEEVITEDDHVYYANSATGRDPASCFATTFNSYKFSKPRATGMKAS